MNKLSGFYELKNLNIPTVDWVEFTEKTELDSKLLWTIRTSVLKGNDVNLPKRIGVNAAEAEKFGKQMLLKYDTNGLIIYYPFFLAKKSGTLMISKDSTIIDAVKGDLWNLVNDNFIDTHLVLDANSSVISENNNFLTKSELSNLTRYVPVIRHSFYRSLSVNESVLLEWSFACKSSLDKKEVGDYKLMFYEVRTVK